MSTAGPEGVRAHRVLGRLTARRFKIAFTYGLTLLENIFELMYPWAIGIAVNGLIQGEAIWLWPLVVIWFAHIVTGGLRQYYDTRLFSRIYADMASDLVVMQREEGRAVSEISARVEMAREMVEFFEEELPVIITAVIGLFGSVILLFVYDSYAGAVMAGLLVPVALINLVAGRSALRLNEGLNDQAEQQVDVIRNGRRRDIRGHFGALARWRVKLSNVDVASWTLAELFALVATVAVLARVASVPGALAGDIFASLAYVIRILDSLDEAPGVVQQASRLIDIRRRIRQL